MNFPTNEPSQGGVGNAGGVGIGVPGAPSAQTFTVGEIGFGPSWQDDEPSLRQMYDAACATIIRLECEIEEANARIAVLEEERNILVKRFDARLHAVGITAEAKAAVIEGADNPYLPSPDGEQVGRERPEPSPHLSETPETDSHSPWRYSIKTPDGTTTHYVPADFARKLERERDEARAQYQTTHLLAEVLAKTQVELKAERDAWKQCAAGLADAVDYYHPALRDAEDGFSAERAAIACFDELEARK